MTNEQALNVLIQSVRIAQGKGAYTLEDAVVIKQAIDVFVKPQEMPKTAPGEVVEDKDVETTESKKKSPAKEI